MLAADFLGWMNEQPPKTITSRVAQKAGMPASGASLDVATGLAHVGFGVVGGSAFGLIARRLPNLLASALVGVGYGLLIWTTSYVAILPSLDLMPGPAEGERRRTPVMVFAHIVYGAVLGMLAYALERRGSSPRP
jgi:putative membrane protein